MNSETSISSIIPPPPTRHPSLKLPPIAARATTNLNSNISMRSSTFGVLSKAALSKAAVYLEPKIQAGVLKVNQIRESAVREWEENNNNNNTSTSTFSRSIQRDLPEEPRSIETSTSTTSIKPARGSSWGISGITGYFSAENRKQRNEIYEESFSERMVCFGGYATIRPYSGEEPALMIELVASGYAYRLRPISQASRSQRVFYSLAKSFAAIPRLPNQIGTSSSEAGQSVENLTSSLEEVELEGNALERLMEVGSGEASLEDENELATNIKESINLSSTPSLSRSNSVSHLNSTSTTSTSSSRPASTTTSNTSNSWPKPFSYTDEDLPRLHNNLNTRLSPFFGQKLSGRKVRISVLPVGIVWETPLVTKVVTTAVGGTFKTNLTIKPKEIKKLLDSGLIEGLGGLERMELRIITELLEAEKGGEMIMRSGSLGYENLRVTSEDSRGVLVGKDGAVRLISDIDDTVKHTEVLGGTRKIFRNVFVREVDEIRVPGMADWYRNFVEEGGEVHYASNGPQELFPVVAEFLDSGGFPLGSVRLKEYGGASSALSKLWEDPGNRKRAAVEEIILEYPCCRFILVGDSGEADLDLYLLLAQLYPKSILAIYIRDVTTPFSPPTSTSTSSSASVTPRSTLNSSIELLEDLNVDPLSPNNPLRPEVVNNDDQTEEMIAQIQTWLFKFEAAKQALPKGIILKTFRHGGECKEETLRLMKGR